MLQIGHLLLRFTSTLTSSTVAKQTIPEDEHEIMRIMAPMTAEQLDALLSFRGALMAKRP